MATFNATLGVGVDEAFMNFYGGVTPVFTVLVPPSGSEVDAGVDRNATFGSPLLAPELYLSCMKAIESNQSTKASTRVSGGNSVNGSRFFSYTSMLGLVSVSFILTLMY